jgi:hypothetical protein
MIGGMRRFAYSFSKWALIAAALDVAIKIIKNQNAIYALIAAAVFGGAMLLTRDRNHQSPEKNASRNPNEPADWY